ncbi:TPA: hypothetical protein JI161_01420 [Acinetobacter baumannii]|nr:hypothetical protein [Acinetobacter baumannii]HAV5737177.1 hypothetical protein [Acinetobacter baumannii]HAV5748710.1 hypothetical protein [Acinetobacter baumannii]HAV5756397.1 hypothetical protein [Acinetobacter baumannii]HAV5763309.1 hypothetical protein [Acinetobacter baumannii]
MTDLNKEREAFERLPLAELAIKSEFVYYNEETNSYWPNEDFCPSDAPETMNFAWEAWQEKAKAQAVLDTQQKLTDTYYLEGSDYVVDCPFEYDIEIDKGEVLELQKWQRTESTKVYFANIYKDEDNFEILQFASKAEAENAVAENLKMLEASESGAEQ